MAGWDFLYVWVEHDTIGDKDYPTFMGYVPVSGVGLCPYLANGEVRKLVYSVSGLSHLEGQIVYMVGDGVQANPIKATVSSGAVSLTTPAAVVHVGLPYTGKVKFLPLSGDGQTVNATNKRKLYNTAFRLFQSLGGKFGKDEDHLSTLDYPVTDDVLFTGDFQDVPFESSVEDIWEPVFVQDVPLPFMLLAAVMTSEIFEDK